MSDPRDPVVERYTNAFGREVTVGKAARRAVLAAMGIEPPGRNGAGRRPPGPDPVAIHAPGARLPGPAELVLEDGSSLGTVDRLPRDLPFGYHHLRDDRHDQLLLVPPARCPSPTAPRGWGWSVQLPATRSTTSWGIGDLADLRTLAGWAAAGGATTLLVSPLCAPNPSPDPEPSPYYPSTRRFRNPLLLRVEEVPGAERVPETRELAAAARRLNDAPLIDRRAVQHLKLAALERIWEVGAAKRALEGALPPALAAYRADAGPALREWAVFAVLAEHHGPGWQGWPVELRSPGSSAVAAFASVHAERVAFHEWLQWCCDEQLARAGDAGVGLVSDLPVGFDPGGFDAWTWQALLAQDARIGAPPDRFSPAGQDWGLPPFVPHRLRSAHLAPFIETVRAALRHAGGLRIDHVMGLFRLWWIPGGRAELGAYVRYPADELLAVLAIESRRAGTVVIGEDLGTVEPGVRRALARRGLLSTRLVYFERRGPGRFPRGAFAAVTTHDLPTIAGTWHRTDLDDQRAAGLAPDPADLEGLRARLARAAGVHAEAPLDEVIVGVHAALAASPATVVSATLEDALRVERRPNLPGTTRAQRANWSEALPVPIEALGSAPLVQRLGAVLGARR